MNKIVWSSTVSSTGLSTEKVTLQAKRKSYFARVKKTKHRVFNLGMTMTGGFNWKRRYWKRQHQESCTASKFPIVNVGWLNNISWDGITIDDHSSVLLQAITHSALSGCDAAGESNESHVTQTRQSRVTSWDLMRGNRNRPPPHLHYAESPNPSRPQKAEWGPIWGHVQKKEINLAANIFLGPRAQNPAMERGD